jgi:hypothetical protein
MFNQSRATGMASGRSRFAEMAKNRLITRRVMVLSLGRAVAVSRRTLVVMAQAAKNTTR